MLSQLDFKSEPQRVQPTALLPVYLLRECDQLCRVQGLPGISLGSAGMFTQGRHPLAVGTHSHPGQRGHHRQRCRLTKQILIPALATPCVGGMIPVHRSQAFYLHRHLSKSSGNHRKLERPKRLSQIQSDVALYEGPVSDT